MRVWQKKHYLYDDIVFRHSEAVWNSLIKFISNSPVFTFVVEGVESIEVVRKLCGATEPKLAIPGTIRGDFLIIVLSIQMKKVFQFTM